MQSSDEIRRARAEWAEGVAKERNSIVLNMCRILGGTEKVALREVDAETGNEKLLDYKGRTVGTIQTRYIGFRPSVICKIAFQLDDP